MPGTEKIPYNGASMEEEAKRLLIMAHELAAAFVDSLFAENAFPAEKLDLALRMGIQGQTQQFLVFVMLSLPLVVNMKRTVRIIINFSEFVKSERGECKTL